jgi:hypothetical protein
VNLEETAQVVKLIAILSPSQRIEPETAAAWRPLLEDVTLRDTLEAVKRLARRQPYIAPSDILAEVRVVRRSRLDAVAVPTPNVDPDDVAAWAVEQRALAAAIADGRMDAAGAAAYARGGRTLTGARPYRAAGLAEFTRPMPALGGVFRGVPQG